MTKRIYGEFPVFASNTKIGDLNSVAGYTYSDEVSYGFYTTGKLAYDKGLSKVEPKVINGALNFVTKGLNYLYNRGVPEFSLGIVYSKGAIVTFNGGLYVSFVDGNNTHVSQSSHWGKFQLEPNGSKYNDYSTQGNCTKDDGLPIGTILTVPVGVTRDGYIDYVQGKPISQTLYPELYKVLGCGALLANTNVSDSELLPVGTILHTLSTQTIPNGWVEWNNRQSIAMYPELLTVFRNIVQSLPLGSYSRLVWEEALEEAVFPDFNNDFFLRASSFPTVLGSYVNDSTSVKQMVVPPVVIDKANTLNPIGLSRATETNEFYSPITGTSKVISLTTKADYVLVAHKTEMYQGTINQLSVGIGSDTPETAPKHLNTRIIVKAKSVTNNVPVTHKQIIKAYRG